MDLGIGKLTTALRQQAHQGIFYIQVPESMIFYIRTQGRLLGDNQTQQHSL